MSAAPIIRLRWLPHGTGLQPPAYATTQAAGMDIRAAVPADKPVVLEAGSRSLIETGIVLALPPGFEAQIRPRSGLAIRHGITCLNTPGTIDADYRGEIKVLLINLGDTPFAIARGDRIAQLVIAPVTHAKLVETSQLEHTSRGADGFGSTGTRPIGA